jgi:HAD superfamily hydrolase (TIGR01458 family)
VGGSAPRAVVLDMEGVLHVGFEPLDGAVEAVRALRERGLPLAILTNTTGKHRRVIAERLDAIGFDFAADEIVTAASATADHLRRRHGGKRVLLLAEPGAADEFDEIPLAERGADAEVVCLGGPDDRFTYARLQEAFGALRRGAAFVAMHRNRWWPTAAGEALDAGCYVRGLEYASGRRARVIGKPSRDVYRAALRACGVEAADAMMVGDDLDSDLATARRLGMATCLVRTGKGASFHPAAGDVTLDLPALADLPAAVHPSDG